ncbi:B12-binding domain-containing radical SAM protein [Candidatus Omnitrophota bacterium]
MGNSKRTIILFNPRSMRGVREDDSPPMGLLMAAIYLHNEFKIAIIDQRVERNWKCQLVNLLKEAPVCIGISAMTGKQIKGGLLASEMAKETGCPVVWGGIHASLLPAQTLENKSVDYVVQGEGEEPFAQLVRAIASKASCRDIPGVWSKENGKAVFARERDFIDLNKLPPIPYDLIDLRKYIKPCDYGKSLVLYTSRGCPQHCTFCFNRAYSRSRWRAMSAQRALEEVERVSKDYPDISHLQFWDDDFFANLNRAREIAEGIRQLQPRVTWSVIGAHVRDISRMDDGYLACLRDSGLKEVLLGVESGSQRIIDLIQKNYVLEELFSSNSHLGNYNIRATYSFLSGIPGESDEDIKKTIEVMFRLKKDNPNIVVGNVKPFICYPGTAIYEKMLASGFQPPERLEDWSDFVWGNYLDVDIPWVSRKRRLFLVRLYYYTVLMNPDYIFTRSKLFTFVASLLRPIAEWRVRRLCFCFPVEAYFMRIIQKFFL